MTFSLKLLISLLKQDPQQMTCKDNTCNYECMKILIASNTVNKQLLSDLITINIGVIACQPNIMSLDYQSWNVHVCVC